MSIVLVPSPLHYVCFTPPLPALAQASFRELRTLHGNAPPQPTQRLAGCGIIHPMLADGCG